jgi:hypothetical protein
MEFQFLWLRGRSPTLLELCHFVSGSGKTPVHISHKNFVNEIFVCISHRDNVLARCDLPSLCSGVKECGTKNAHNFLFLKSSFRIQRTTVLGLFKDSAVILYAV